MRGRAGFLGLGAALSGAILMLASCGQPVPFTQLSFARVLTLNRPAPAPPLSISLTAASTGAALQPDSWTNSSQLRLEATLPPDAPSRLMIEAEFVPEQQPLVGQPNVVGKPGETTIKAPALKPGERYHWAARLRDPAGGASPWIHSPGEIGYQPTPPPPPLVQPLPHDGWLATRQVQLTLDAQSDSAGIAGFAYSLDQTPAGALPVRIDTQARNLSLTIPKDGDWYVHLRTIDGAGNASGVATVPIHLDSSPLRLEPLKIEPAGAWNPTTGPLNVQLKASKPAQLAVSILPEKADTPVRTFNFDGQSEASLAWDGKNASGQSVPVGNYRLRVDAADNTGRTALAVIQDPLLVTNKRIAVSLGQQRLVAYEGDKPVLSTLVTSGGPELPTPVGTFRVIEKRYRFKFHSPWPKGSPYWYEDSQTTYALLFEGSGYFIHDAPWRSWFGPGSNAIDGRPGADGTGTHGCVNVPFGMAQQLYSWADVGTPVMVSG